MRNLAFFFAAVFLFGCVTQPQESIPQLPQDTGFENNASGLDAGIRQVDLNIFESGQKDLKLTDLNSVKLDLDLNKIFFNFEIDLNSQNLDFNVLKDACIVSCSAIDANSWKVIKDINFSEYYCTCTRTICYDRKETPQAIINYCFDKSVLLEFAKGVFAKK